MHHSLTSKKELIIMTKEKETLYYAMDRHPFAYGRWINQDSISDEIRFARWMRGNLITDPLPQPFRFEVSDFNHENKNRPAMLEYMEGDMPILRNDLIEALAEIGVNNFQFFDLILLMAKNTPIIRQSILSAPIALPT
jgi:hypothetical protein